MTINDGLHVLLVEDNDALSHNIAEYFESRGHRLDFATNGEDGVRAAKDIPVDAVIMDVSLPKLDGFSACRQIRRDASRYMPILMLTARDALSDKLMGFEVGADDYLAKPFELAELEARCLALCRRHGVLAQPEVTVGTLRLDRQRLTATRDGIPLQLNRIGYRILLILAEAYPRVVTRFELAERLWEGDPPDSDALRTHLYMLRQRLDKPFDHAMLVTVHSVGFRLQAEA